MRRFDSAWIPWATAVAALLMPVAATSAQEDEGGVDWGDYEYESDEGLHEEEWYDPSDWFDSDEGVDFEDDDWYDTEWYGEDQEDDYTIDDETFDDWYAADYYRADDWHAQAWSTRLGDTQQPLPTVRVDLRDFWISMPGELLAGRTRFLVHNTGDRAHAFGIRGQGTETSTRRLRPDQTATLEADLEPGRYRVYCPVAGHEQRGMTRSIRVVREQGDEQQRPQPRAELGQPGARESIQGELESVDRVHFDLVPDDHHVVRVRLDDGRVVFADLGRELTLDQLDLEEGDEITLDGRRRWIEGKPIFVLDRISGEDLTWEVLPENVNLDAPRSISGTIRGFQRVGLVGGGQHVLVKLFSDQGAVVADLGAPDRLQGLNLQRGDPLTLHGRRLWLDGHLVFWAQRLETDQRSEPVSLRR